MISRSPCLGLGLLPQVDMRWVWVSDGGLQGISLASSFEAWPFRRVELERECVTETGEEGY